MYNQLDLEVISKTFEEEKEHPIFMIFLSEELHYEKDPPKKL
jgi:hypothetical protein